MTCACTELTGDFSDVIAIEYTGPPSPQVQEGDTLRLTARALDQAGDSIPDVQIVWRILEVDTVMVGFDLDSLTGLVTAHTPGGPWRVQGRIENLRMNPPINVTVTAAPDSLAGPDSSRVTVAAGQTVSAPIILTVFDLTSTPGQPIPLANVPVTVTLIDPAPGTAAADGVALGIQGVIGEDPHRADGLSLPNGQVPLTLHRVGSVQPDSAIVEATAFTARGAVVPGSPVRLTVVFLTN